MKREYKTFKFNVTKIDYEGRTIEGYASVFGNIDLGGDIVHRGAFTKTLVERGGKVKLLWQHNEKEPVGRPIEIREDDVGLYVKAIISPTRRGLDSLALLKDGAIDGLSIGYDPIDGGTDYSSVDGRKVRNLREVRLWEFSLVTFPMNEAAGVTSLKTVTSYQDFPLAPRDREWDATAADARVRSWAGAEDEPNDKYATAFFWYDSENSDDYGAYKFPYVDIIDGNPHAVFRGVSAGAARLDGSDIPDQDKDKIKAHMQRYYDKASDEYNDDTLVSPWKQVELDTANGIDTSNSDEKQIKRGRVLSKLNEDKLRAALASITEVLDQLISDDSTPGESGRDAGGGDKEAGPRDAPTECNADGLEDKRIKLLKHIETLRGA